MQFLQPLPHQPMHMAKSCIVNSILSLITTLNPLKKDKPAALPLQGHALRVLHEKFFLYLKNIRGKKFLIQKPCICPRWLE
jgi:hypothetical protein